MPDPEEPADRYPSDRYPCDRDLVDALLALDGKPGAGALTAWEIDFIESLDSQLDESSDSELSERQREVAERILEERG